MDTIALAGGSKHHLTKEYNLVSVFANCDIVILDARPIVH